MVHIKEHMTKEDMDFLLLNIYHEDVRSFTDFDYIEQRRETRELASTKARTQFNEGVTTGEKNLCMIAASSLHRLFISCPQVNVYEMYTHSSIDQQYDISVLVKLILHYVGVKNKLFCFKVIDQIMKVIEGAIYSSDDISHEDRNKTPSKEDDTSSKDSKMAASKQDANKAAYSSDDSSHEDCNMTPSKEDDTSRKEAKKAAYKVDDTALKKTSIHTVQGKESTNNNALTSYKDGEVEITEVRQASQVKKVKYDNFNRSTPQLYQSTYTTPQEKRNSDAELNQFYEKYELKFVVNDLSKICDGTCDGMGYCWTMDKYLAERHPEHFKLVKSKEQYCKVLQAESDMKKNGRNYDFSKMTKEEFSKFKLPMGLYRGVSCPNIKGEVMLEKYKGFGKCGKECLGEAIFSDRYFCIKCKQNKHKKCCDQVHPEVICLSCAYGSLSMEAYLSMEDW